ncbi:UNVERIFIED_CONTAM: putative DNA-binding transcriptional regulator YafY [Pseudacidovorax intermedius]|nr:putative DNA-binding transcriptional regulator YafY [Pseudacidovorax intermedius]
MKKKVDIFNYPPVSGEHIKNVIPIIMESIAEKRQLTIEYRTVDEKISTRTVEVVGVFFEFNYWYFMAFCTLRNDFRQFRIDRIRQIMKTQNPFLQEYGQINDYRSKPNGNKTRVRLMVDKKIVGHLVNSKKYYGIIEEILHEEGIEMIFETDWIEEGFPRWLITFADYAKVLEPDSLRSKIRELAERILNRL